MRNIRKFFSMLMMIVSISAQATFAMEEPDDLLEIFDTNLSGERITFIIESNDYMCAAVFFDESMCELNMAACSLSEYGKLKKVAFECKFLMKDVSTLQEYERKNIYAQIMEKLKSLAPLPISEDYESDDNLGFVKESLYISEVLYGEYQELVLSQAESSDGTSSEKKLSVWSFTDELEGFLNVEGYGYRATHPDMEIEYTFIPTDQFPSRLDPRIASGQDCPDVFGLEDAFVRKYVESGLLLPLDDLYEEVKNKVNSYPVEVGSYDGHVYAMSWQVAPGAVFYHRSLAKKYWGTDNPVEVQKKLSDLDTFLATARELKYLSKGKCRIVSTIGDLFMPYKGTRNQPWIVNDKLVIDPAMEKYMDVCKIMEDEQLAVSGVGQWSEGWFAGMNGTLKDETGADVEIMCYFLPTWGLHYVLKTNAPGTSGDWAMCQGPSAWRWGGTWIAAYKGTKNPEAAKELIRYLTTDDGFLESMAMKTGDVVSNVKVQYRIKRSFSDSYLAGQNHYAEFCKYAKKVNGSLEQATDWQIESIWHEAVMSYVSWERTKKQALQYFKDQVSFTMGF